MVEIEFGKWSPYPREECDMCEEAIPETDPPSHLDITISGPYFQASFAVCFECAKAMNERAENRIQRIKEDIEYYKTQPKNPGWWQKYQEELKNKEIPVTEESI